MASAPTYASVTPAEPPNNIVSFTGLLATRATLLPAERRPLARGWKMVLGTQVVRYKRPKPPGTTARINRILRPDGSENVLSMALRDHTKKTTSNTMWVL